ncbi:MAG: plasma membrane localization protein [Claussenomyces sp. TS43310]|nr:MAG: plasma membrane localization protein [Claussenomyces sp. TS43310]
MTRGAVDVKPNSSELSYLLYYATTRRTKVQKVGAFLEKKTASDVWRARIGNVQVTLQIFAALIEKAPRDLPLYAPYVLKILNLILRSDDITMIESSIPTFEAFCEHHDGASLSADQEYLRQYMETVKLYASFASMRSASSNIAPSTPVAMRWRIAGLQAIKAVTSSEPLASVAGRQLDIIIPALLKNLWTNTPHYLDTLLKRAQAEERTDEEKAIRRRMSNSTVDTANDPNTLALSATTADADKLAEEDIGVLALQCLKQIFVVNTRVQIREATIATIQFIEHRVMDKSATTNQSTEEQKEWCTSILRALARWAPVQDRYAILVTAMETLVNSPLTENNIAHQLLLSTMVGSLLRSDINLIGLSVMDVLLGLVMRILRILQLDGNLHQVEILRDLDDQSKQKSPSTSTNGVGVSELYTSASKQRQALLSQLQQCVADLATHVYYADQISDMIAAILLRLKPSPMSSIGNAAAAIEDPETTNEVLLSSANLSEDPRTDGFFSFATAKLVALSAIKKILLVATKKGKISAGATLVRNRVGLRVWEGTQWLLRDGDGKVRKAYVDALLVWLDREMVRSDLKVLDDRPIQQSSNKSLTRNGGDDSAVNLARRAASSASHREKTPKPSKTSFVQLLHLAVYENAHQYIESKSDVLLLHLLLVNLVDKLGVNAVKSGLPMIFRLQEDIQEVETLDKVRMGSLCHGYFWAVSEKLGFESSGVGRNIYNEINRRRNKGFWIEEVRLPPVPLDMIGTPGSIAPQQDLPMREIESESLTPFDDRTTMVQLISAGYSSSILSLTSSPPTSPGRSFSHPILSNVSSEVSSSEHELPITVKEQMLSDWSKESVIAGAQDHSKTVSLNGSRTTGTTPLRNFLAVNSNLNPGGRDTGSQSPPKSRSQLRSRPPSQVHGNGGGINALHQLRKGSIQEGSIALASDSDQAAVARVDHLKRVLSGQAPPTRGLGATQSNSSSDSMVSYDGTELSFDNRGTAGPPSTSRGLNDAIGGSTARDRVPSPGDHLRPLNSNPVQPVSEAAVPEIDEEEADRPDFIPPVPPLPTTMHLPGSFPTNGTPVERPATAASAQRHGAGLTAARTLESRTGQSWQNGLRKAEAEPAVDLLALLQAIDTSAPPTMGFMSKPPY